MPDDAKYLDLENLATHNPLVDKELCKAASKTVNKLRELGIKPVDYNLVHPFSQSLYVRLLSPRTSAQEVSSKN